MSSTHDPPKIANVLIAGADGVIEKERRTSPASTTYWRSESCHLCFCRVRMPSHKLNDRCKVAMCATPGGVCLDLDRVRRLPTGSSRVEKWRRMAVFRVSGRKGSFVL